jgi:hypothetical protein
MTMMTIQSQVGTVILSSGTRRFYGERTGTCNVRPTRLLKRGIASSNQQPVPWILAGDTE